VDSKRRGQPPTEVGDPQAQRVEGIERFVPHIILKQNLDPEYYNKKVKCLKV
jgi:hypothetical protein